VCSRPTDISSIYLVIHRSLKLQKDKLDTIAGVQGASVDELERQLAETKQIYNKLQQNLQGDILNNLIEVALACDEDADMVLSDQEINGAIERLEQVHGIDVDNEGVRKALIQNGRSMDGKILLEYQYNTLHV
jgi:hypothetical protein